MRFDCGETWEEEKARKRAWHKWFAWHPIMVKDHDCRWLEYVERSGKFWASWGDSGWNWSYRDVGTADVPNISTYDGDE